MHSAIARFSRWAVVCAAVGTASLLAASPASAAVYPPGQGSFSGNAQGWQASEQKCQIVGIEIGLLCSTDAGYADDQGNPPGSLALNSQVTLNLLSLFKSSAVFESPQFTVNESGPATLRLERQFAPGGLTDLVPSASYSVTLEDKTGGESIPAGQATLGTGAGEFTGESAGVSVKAGRSYAIRIGAEVASTVGAGLLISGTSSLRFDNVNLATGSDHGGDGKGRGGSGAGGGNEISNRQLLTVLRSSSTTAPVVLRGKRLFVKVNCPRRVGRACVIVAQGMLNRRRAATVKRRVKVGKGKGRQIVLRVKPRQLAKVKKRKRLLVRQQVRAGKAKATFYKQRRLIRRR